MINHMAMQDHVGEGWTAVRPKQAYMKAVQRLARVLETACAHARQHIKRANLAWKKRNDAVFRVLEDSAEVSTGCGGTPDRDNQHIKIKQFRRYKSVAQESSCRCIDSLQRAIRVGIEIEIHVQFGWGLQQPRQQH